MVPTRVQVQHELKLHLKYICASESLENRTPRGGGGRKGICVVLKPIPEVNAPSGCYRLWCGGGTPTLRTDPDTQSPHHRADSNWKGVKVYH